MRVICLVLMLLLGAPGAHAGAWPRGEGQAFLSFSQAHSADPGQRGGTPDSYAGLYAEYGLGPRLTLGLDAGHARDAGSWTAIAYLRRSLDRGAGRHRVAAELGLGARGRAGRRAEPVLRPGLSWGMGLNTRWGPGWAGVESYAEHRVESAETALKADTTLGLKPRPGRMLILQIQTGDYPGAAPYLRLAPSLVQRVGRHGHLELGLTAAALGDTRVGVKLGTWVAF
ncbi:hypothetical protein Ga0609869_003239 [Rhodovulum iodosum]|uniref:Cellulose biosynthesis protein BcsS n=1 Tax=Rhodovulum iodosum TaxID=68291 RepID=A0ABV3XWY4_9RHOB|nr:hypothetical protein [Rhodovulum robiginosum]RSK34080.1 hypothetical protein EJA01_08095 [Rhodovulum robiginosum]